MQLGATLWDVFPAAASSLAYFVAVGMEYGQPPAAAPLPL